MHEKEKMNEEELAKNSQEKNTIESIQPPLTTNEELEKAFFVDHSTPTSSQTSTTTTSDKPPKALSQQSQIEVLRKQLHDEAELEKPEYISVVVTTILILILSLILGFLYKIWWMALLFGIASAGGTLLLWLLFTKLLTGHEKSFELSWFFASTALALFSFYFFSSPLIGLSFLALSMINFSIFRLIFLEKRETTWEELGLPKKVQQLILSLPEKLPPTAQEILDNALEEYGLLYDLLEKKAPNDRPLDKRNLRKDAERLLIILFRKTLKKLENPSEVQVSSSPSWDELQESIDAFHNINHSLQEYLFSQKIDQTEFRKRYLLFRAFSRKK